MRKFYNIVEDNKAPNVQSLWLHNGSLSYFGNNGWETVGDAASLEELGNKVDSLNNEIKSIASDIDNIHDTLENIPSGGSYTEITWQELKNLRDNGQLSAGSLYRITDYQCTTVQENTRSAGNQFDIIVLALTNNTLSEQAWAALHEGDSYFANSNLSAWKLWYCLDNDTTRFDWADNTSGNGRGVIYRMIDEFNNDIPYDFKNIQCTEWSGSFSGIYFYTFNLTSSTPEDSSLSIENEVRDNIIVTGFIEYSIPKINNTIFIGRFIFSNKFQMAYKNTIIGPSTQNFVMGIRENFINSGFCDNLSLSSFLGNTITGEFRQNTIIMPFISNTIKGYFLANVINRGFSKNVINEEFSANILLEDVDRCTTNYKLEHNIFYKCFKLIINYSNTGGGKYISNYIFTQNLKSPSGSNLTLNLDSNRKYETKVGLNSNGEVKQWCEADLVG